MPELQQRRRVVFMDVEIHGRAAGRLVFELYAHVAPRTCANFEALCVGRDAGDNAEGLHFAGCPFHRIVPGFMVQGGDITRGDGTGGRSIYGARFRDETFALRHDKVGVLSMANAGPHTNGSQFFVTLARAPHLDGKHVAFGRLVEGGAVLRKLEALGDDDGRVARGGPRVARCGAGDGEPEASDDEAPPPPPPPRVAAPPAEAPSDDAGAPVANPFEDLPMPAPLPPPPPPPKREAPPQQAPPPPPPKREAPPPPSQQQPRKVARFADEDVPTGRAEPFVPAATFEGARVG